MWVLHLGYLWLPLGLALKAIYIGTGMYWASAWMHALGIGVASMMIVAVMTRATLGHTGRPLVVTNRGRPVLEVRPVAEKRVDPRELLRGSVLYYERPFDPVGEEDWEALGESR